MNLQMNLTAKECRAAADAAEVWPKTDPCRSRWFSKCGKT